MAASGIVSKMLLGPPSGIQAKGHKTTKIFSPFQARWLHRNCFLGMSCPDSQTMPGNCLGSARWLRAKAQQKLLLQFINYLGFDSYFARYYFILILYIYICIYICIYFTRINIAQELQRSRWTQICREQEVQDLGMQYFQFMILS